MNVFCEICTQLCLTVLFARYEIIIVNLSNVRLNGGRAKYKYTDRYSYKHLIVIPIKSLKTVYFEFSTLSRIKCLSSIKDVIKKNLILLTFISGFWKINGHFTNIIFQGGKLLLSKHALIYNNVAASFFTIFTKSFQHKLKFSKTTPHKEYNLRRKWKRERERQKKVVYFLSRSRDVSCKIGSYAKVCRQAKPKRKSDSK